DRRGYHAERADGHHRWRGAGGGPRAADRLSGRNRRGHVPPARVIGRSCWQTQDSQWQTIRKGRTMSDKRRMLRIPALFAAVALAVAACGGGGGDSGGSDELSGAT